MRNFSIKNTKWLNKGHELDYLAALILRPNNKFYLVGSHKEIINFNNRADGEIKRRIKGIVLTENTSTGDELDYHVISDDEIPRGVDTIVVCTSHDRGKYESIRQLFHGYGFEENRQFFQGEIFNMIYEVYVNDRICLDRVEVFVTSYCPLKCEKCIAYIPYFSHYEHIPLEKLIRDADILFSKVDYIYKLKILGGDGLAYIHLDDYLKYVCENYRKKIQTIRIGTNGTILPKKNLLQLCKEYDVVLDVSDYRESIGNRSKIEEIVELCNLMNVKVDIKRTGEQWLDMGFPNKLPGERSEENLKQHFSRCAMFCRDFYDGCLFYCCSNFAAVKAGLFPLNENDFFDFKREFNKKELLEYEIGFSELGHTTFCMVCRGCSDEANPFHVEVAKQVSGYMA